MQIRVIVKGMGKIKTPTSIRYETRYEIRKSGSQFCLSNHFLHSYELWLYIYIYIPKCEIFEA